MSPNEISHFLREGKVSELLALHGAILDALRARKIVRGGNAPAGDYAEYLFEKAFAWKLEGSAQKGYDAKDSTGRLYQIKSRRIAQPEQHGSRQLSAIRDLQGKSFHFLAAVLFNADYSVHRAIIIPHELLKEPRVHFSEHVNGWLFSLKDDVWKMRGVRDVTDDLKAAADSIGR